VAPANPAVSEPDDAGGPGAADGFELDRARVSAAAAPTLVA
jgi:hypothetical protein